MKLLITEPTAVVTDRADVVSVRAEDESGSFGILRGHADLVTVLPLSVLAWRQEDGTEGFCAVRHAVLTVHGGTEVAIAARQAQLGTDLDQLEHAVLDRFRTDEEAERVARVAELRLHTEALRRIISALRPNHPEPIAAP
jgi:F-type H+-transporting ATPase subunit epsilon